MQFFSHLLARFIDSCLCHFVSFVTGIRPQSEKQFTFNPKQKVYYANHTSHGDFMLVWVSLPQTWRMETRPVAAAEYWQKNRLRRFIIQQVFNGVLIDRQSEHPEAAMIQMSEALQHHSLILFPEGTRNTNENQPLQSFKSGIYYLAQKNPHIEFVPIWIDNISRVLPKGKWLPIPLLCDVYIGKPLRLSENESKQAFLERTTNALLALNPNQTEEK
ncbi:1-acyl-sn-glycerol-3-phosphate acyltransferase [Rodentibacter rarus]|uniref:1-acyl-sn-glycerol-3-phosphate acyltransferase n=1 Tax=Rodentibacter rarus TaxID=1908260 RepID=A0A1V3ISF2_9PAST|nr:lysophospholipid acyltransferase family protein [Rodentibacter rarus]OOF43229.1 1-acyl-sn-glycerol-3-phosphate acyltransferase [Rodentibacter rarus]OOF44864.1 1-acyl-sn-glycerol-3-phosphate acyltransferase [Rodentibacter rarus]